MNERKKRILAIASGGGHWEQLLRLRPAFDGHDLAFVTVNRAYASDVEPHRFHAVDDATRWNKLKLIRMAFQLLWIVLRERPDVIVSTGAAPGYIGIRLGKLLGARTVWIDSIANVEELSMSGKRIGKHADMWLTQWAHLAGPEGPQCAGSVL